MPVTYYLDPKKAADLVEQHTPGEPLPRKGGRLLIVRPYLQPTITVEPFIEDGGKKLFQITVG